MNTEQFMTPEQIREQLKAFDSNEPQIRSTQIDHRHLQSLIPAHRLHEFTQGSSGIVPCTSETNGGLDVTNLPASVDLRKWCSAVDNQGSEGTCTAFAAIAYLAFKIMKETGIRFDLSEWFHWLNYQKYNSWDSSTTLTKFWQGEERLWPNYSGAGLAGWDESRRATLTGPREIHSVAAMKAQLAKGEPLLLSVGLDTAYWTNAVVLGDRGTQKSGHAILCVGYRDDPQFHSGGYFIIQNSWGADTGYGDKGFNYVSYDYMYGSRFWTNNIIFDDAVLWREGKKPNTNKVTEADLKAVTFKKYSYNDSGKPHTAYGVTIDGKDKGRVKSVNFKITEGLPLWDEAAEFKQTFGTWAQSGWQAGTAEVTLDDGSKVSLPVTIP